MQKGIGKIKPMELCLILVFISQLIVSIYFNLALLGEHMGYDSSWSYLKAGLIWREKALVSEMWAEQTNIFLDSTILPAALFYGITDNLLVSYGISNSIVLLGIIYCMSGIVKELQMRKGVRLLCANLLICPYMVNGFAQLYPGLFNELGYFNCLISGPAFYSVRVLLFLMVVSVIIHLRNKKKPYVCAVLSFLLCVLAGVSSGVFMAIILLLPCIVYFIEVTLIDNRLAELRRPEALYVYICLFCVFIGKIIGDHMLDIAAIDASRTWTSIEKIWMNTGAVIQGLMILLGVLPVLDTTVPVLSREGIVRCFPIAIFVVVIASIVFCIVLCLKNLKKADRNLLLFCNVLICNFMVFSLFNVQYGSFIFEERYLLCTYMIIIILVGYFLDSMDKKLFVSATVELLLIAGIVGVDVVSDYNYINTTNGYLQMAETKELVETTDAGLVYCWGNNLLLLQRNMRVYDLSRVYKSITNEGEYHHWGDYLYYENNADYTGATVLMIARNADQIVPDQVLSRYRFIGSTEMADIYYCPDNPVDLSPEN